jgi:hypothetical protein
MSSICTLLANPVEATNKPLQTITITPTAVATIVNKDAQQNSSELRVGFQNEEQWMTFLKFDLSNITTNAKIVTANLELKSATFPTTGNRWVKAFTYTTDWSENTITWNNKQSTRDYIDDEFVNQNNEWYFWDCTSTLSGGEKTFSVALRLLYGADGYVSFYSKQTQNEPKLEIEYYVSSPSMAEQMFSIITIILEAVAVALVLYIMYYLLKTYESNKKKKTTVTESGK